MKKEEFLNLMKLEEYRLCRLLKELCQIKIKIKNHGKAYS